MQADRRRLCDYLFIVPEAHFKLNDFDFQVEIYDVFHRRWGSRIGHMMATPLVMTGIFALLGLLPVAPVNALLGDAPVAHGLALPVAVVLLAWFISMDRWAGLLMIPPMAATLVAAQLFNHFSGDHALRNGLVLVYASSFVQMASHAFEEFPPPLSGSAGWVPFKAWIRRVDMPALLGLALASATVYTALECWASTRVWFLQMLLAMMAFGYRPELRQTLRVRVPEILADPRNGWGPERWAKPSSLQRASSAAELPSSP